MRVYLDTCCINRAFDDQASERVRQETRAIQVFLDTLAAGEVTWVASDLVRLEVSRIRDANRRTAVEILMSLRQNPVGGSETSINSGTS